MTVITMAFCVSSGRRTHCADHGPAHRNSTGGSSARIARFPAGPRSFGVAFGIARGSVPRQRSRHNGRRSSRAARLEHGQPARQRAQVARDQRMQPKRRYRDAGRRFAIEAQQRSGCWTGRRPRHARANDRLCVDLAAVQRSTGWYQHGLQPVLIVPGAPRRSTRARAD